MAISITQVLARSYKNALDWTSLCVIPGKLVWAIYVDALVRVPPEEEGECSTCVCIIIHSAAASSVRVQVLDFEGNPYDAISIATRAALHNTMYL